MKEFMDKEKIINILNGSNIGVNDFINLVQQYNKDKFNKDYTLAKIRGEYDKLNSMQTHFFQPVHLVMEVIENYYKSLYNHTIVSKGNMQVMAFWNP